MPEQQQYKTFMAIKPAKGHTPEQQAAFSKAITEIIGYQGGTLKTLAGNVYYASFGSSEDSREQHGLAACLAAQRIQSLQPCQIVLHCDVASTPAQATFDLLPAAGAGQIILSNSLFDAVKNLVLARSIRMAGKTAQDGVTVHLLRKIVDRNMPLFYVRQSLSQPVPLVGRESEIAEILGHAESSFTEKSRHLHIEGAAGSGKTRLLYALIDHLDERYPGLCILSAPSGRVHRRGGTPVQDFLCDVCAEAGLAFKNRGEVRDGFIGMDLTNDLFACAYLDAHGMKGISSVWLEMRQADQQFFQAELAARIVAYISRQRPVIALFDDVHKNWGYNQVLIQALRNNFENASIMTLSISKKSDLFKGEPDAIIRLKTLPDDDIRRIVSSILFNEKLHSYTDEIATRANGSPYFAIQLANHLKLEVSEKMHFKSNVGIPESLDSLFAVQIKHMNPVLRAVLSCCAVLGQKFSLQPLYQMLEMTPASVDNTLRQLEEQGFLYIHGQPADMYEFTHDLAQECVYRSLPSAERKALHRKTLDVLRHVSASDLRNRPSLMAYHAFYADRYDLAYAYGFAAGMHDLERCLPSQAEESLSQALISLCRMPDNAKRQKRMAYTLLHLARAMALNCKPKESLDVLKKIAPGDYTQSFKNQCTLLETSIQWSTATYSYDQIRDIKTRIGLMSRMGIGNGLRCAGMLSDLGHFAESNDCIREIYPILERTDRKGHFGMLFPAASYCLALMSRNYAEMGQFDHAHVYAVQACEEIEHMFPAQKVYGLAFSAVHYQRQNQHEKALTLLKEAYFLAKEFQIGLIFPFTACNYAYSLYMATKDPVAFSIIRNGLNYAEKRGYFCRWGMHSFQYAQMLDAAGRSSDAVRQGLIALQAAKKYNEAHVEAQIKVFLQERGVAYEGLSLQEKYEPNRVA